LSHVMGERKTKLTDVTRDTGINRATLMRLYHETAVRVEPEVVEKRCELFSRQVGDLFE
jgi:putative transcriptional regulator